MLGTESFDSLQTGKQIQSLQCSRNNPRIRVSIPFKRESRSKAKPYLQFVITAPIVCFHSLQTGKQIQRNRWIYQQLVLLGFHSLQTGKQIQRHSTDNGIQGHREFPFPSNGKAYPKHFGVVKSNGGYYCFHSLQTGKPIQRNAWLERVAAEDR